MTTLFKSILGVWGELMVRPEHADYIASFLDEVEVLPEDSEVSIRTREKVRWVPGIGDATAVYPEIKQPNTSLFERAVKGLLATKRKNPDSAFSKSFVGGRLCVDQGGPMLLLAGPDPTCAEALQYLFNDTLKIEYDPKVGANGTYTLTQTPRKPSENLHKKGGAADD